MSHRIFRNLRHIRAVAMRVVIMLCVLQTLFTHLVTEGYLFQPVTLPLFIPFIMVGWFYLDVVEAIYPTECSQLVGVILMLAGIHLWSSNPSVPRSCLLALLFMHWLSTGISVFNINYSHLAVTGFGVPLYQVAIPNRIDEVESANDAFRFYRSSAIKVCYGSEQGWDAYSCDDHYQIGDPHFTMHVSPGTRYRLWRGNRRPTEEF